MVGLIKAWSSLFHLEQAWWNLKLVLRSFERRFGWVGWLILTSLLMAILAWGVEHRQAKALIEAKGKLAQHRPAPVVVINPVQINSAEHIHAFDVFLLPHNEIPAAIEELLRLAGEQRLVALKGEYRPTIEPQGQFMRYRMLIPVKGEAQAIRHFMQAAMLAQKALALESIQFKRDRIDSTQIEAKINWVLITQLPPHPELELASEGPTSSSESNISKSAILLNKIK
ncbi:MAG: hypothetical protein WCD07_12475 [Burkholderiales bacterium]